MKLKTSGKKRKVLKKKTPSKIKRPKKILKKKGIIDIPISCFISKNKIKNIEFIKNSSYKIIEGSLLKIASIIMIIALNLTGLSAVLRTIAYFSDVKESLNNTFIAGNLDFEIATSTDINFEPQCLENNATSTRIIKINNYGNLFKYTASSTDYSSELCNYAILDANLNGDESEYNGKLINFKLGPLNYTDIDSWKFNLSLPSNIPEYLEGKICEFKIVFFASQVKNNLPFGIGFTDSEEATSSIESMVCEYGETRTMGYWKNHKQIYQDHLPQFLGDYPHDININNVCGVNKIFNDYNLSMKNKLKGQLLAMKFNIANFGIGNYKINNDTTINDIVLQADNLLRQNPPPCNKIFENLKNLIEYWNSDHHLKICGCKLSENINKINNFENLPLQVKVENVFEIENNSELILNNSQEQKIIATSSDNIIIFNDSATTTSEIKIATSSEENINSPENNNSELNSENNADLILENSINNVLEETPKENKNNNLSQDEIIVNENNNLSENKNKEVLIENSDILINQEEDILI